MQKCLVHYAKATINKERKYKVNLQIFVQSHLFSKSKNILKIASL